MCGVVGIVVKNRPLFPVDLFRRFLMASQIRGQHATGMSWEISGRSKTLKEAVPASEFLIPDDVFRSRVAIGHMRYSTSDLAFNQPMVEQHRCLVMNGVISQADPSTWKEKFGVDCETRNDAEIALRMWVNGNHPLLLEKSSQACILLDAPKGMLYFWRNEERPLYYLENESYLLVASTRDIFKRADMIGVIGEPIKCVPGVQYSFSHWSDQELQLRQSVIREPIFDLQA